MKKTFISFLLISMAILIISGVWFKKHHYYIDSGPDRYLSVDSIHEGMKGFGLSVFKGTQPEAFQVTILGVVKNWKPGSALILAEIHHPIVDEAGIIAGMSGSPVYINGKLIGALAYGWSFQKRPICGITPIHSMLNPQESPVSGSGQLSDYSNIPKGCLRPVSLPITMNGASAEFYTFLSREMKKQWGDSVLLTSGGGSVSSESSPRAVPVEGGAVAVPLVSGDLSLAAVGTITCIDKDTLYAFGHPFSSDGTVSLPMNSAYVYTVISSLYSSFKLASSSFPIGTLTYDYAYGIKGILRKHYRLIPVKVHIVNQDTNREQKFSFSVVHDKQWSPFMVRAAVAYSLSNSSLVDNDTSIWTDAQIIGHDFSTLQIHDFSNGSEVLYGTYRLKSDIRFLMDNPISSCSIDGVNVDVRIRNGRLEKNIQRIRVPSLQVKPGEKLNITLYLKQDKKTEYSETITVTVPKDIPHGTVYVNVYNGLRSLDYDQERAPGLYNAKTIKQAVALRNMPFDVNTLIVDFSVDAPGVVVKGTEFDDVPDSVRSLYSRMQDSSVISLKLWKRIALKRQDVILGCASVQLDVSPYH